MNLKLTAVIWKTVLLKLMSNLLSAVKNWKRTDAQLYMSRVGFQCLPNKKTLAWEETLEIRHDNRNFYERKTNQKECPD